MDIVRKDKPPAYIQALRREQANLVYSPLPSPVLLSLLFLLSSLSFSLSSLSICHH